MPRRGGPGTAVSHEHRAHRRRRDHPRQCGGGRTGPATALGALAGMGQDAVRLQVASAIDAVVHLERTGTGARWRASGSWRQRTRAWLSPPHWKSQRPGPLRAGVAAAGGPARPGSRIGRAEPPPVCGAGAGARPPGPEAGPPGPGAAMTAVLIIVLVLAIWLAFPSRAAAGRRTRRALPGAGTPGPAPHRTRGPARRRCRPGRGPGNRTGESPRVWAVGAGRDRRAGDGPR